MILNSDLPPNYEQGRFHVPGLGLFIKMKKLRIIIFNGLRMHGGTPPVAPENQTVEPWAYRLAHVLYPPARMLSPRGKTMVAFATGRSSFAAEPPSQEVNSTKGDEERRAGPLVCITPEMTSLG